MAMVSSLRAAKGLAPSNSRPRMTGPKIQRTAARTKTARTIFSPRDMAPSLRSSLRAQSLPPGMPSILQGKRTFTSRK